MLTIPSRRGLDKLSSRPLSPLVPYAKVVTRLAGQRAALRAAFRSTAYRYDLAARVDHHHRVL